MGTESFFDKANIETTSATSTFSTGRRPFCTTAFFCTTVAAYICCGARALQQVSSVRWVATDETTRFSMETSMASRQNSCEDTMTRSLARGCIMPSSGHRSLRRRGLRPSTWASLRAATAGHEPLNSYSHRDSRGYESCCTFKKFTTWLSLTSIWFSTLPIRFAMRNLRLGREHDADGQYFTT